MWFFKFLKPRDRTMGPGTVVAFVIFDFSRLFYLGLTRTRCFLIIFICAFCYRT